MFINSERPQGECLEALKSYFLSIVIEKYCLIVLPIFRTPNWKYLVSDLRWYAYDENQLKIKKTGQNYDGFTNILFKGAGETILVSELFETILTKHWSV